MGRTQLPNILSTKMYRSIVIVFYLLCFVSSKAQTPVFPYTDLSISNNASEGHHYIHDTITLTVTAINWGPTDATEVIVNDSLPKGITILTITTTKGVYNLNNRNWSIGQLRIAESCTLNVTLIIDTAGGYFSKALIYGNVNDTVIKNSLAWAMMCIDYPIVRLEGKDTICDGSIITNTYTYQQAPENAAAGSSLTYNWVVPCGWDIVSGQGTDSADITAGCCPGEVVLEITNACGFKSSIDMTVTPLNIALSPAIKVIYPECLGGSIYTFSIDTSTGVTQFRWGVPDDWTIVSGQGTSSIKVQLGNADGYVYAEGKKDVNSCVNAAYKAVAAELQPSPLVVPNTFTPNGDGNNDTWVIQNLENFESSEVTLSNRLGDRVYYQLNYKNDFNGLGLSEGTYYFELSVGAIDCSESFHKTGYLTLIR